MVACRVIVSSPSPSPIPLPLNFGFRFRTRIVLILYIYLNVRILFVILHRIIFIGKVGRIEAEERRVGYYSNNLLIGIGAMNCVHIHNVRSGVKSRYLW